MSASSEKPIRASSRPSEVSQLLPWKQVPPFVYMVISNSRMRTSKNSVLSRQILESCLLSAPFSSIRLLLQATDGLIPRLCPKAESRESKHVRSSETQSPCVGCFCHRSATSPPPVRHQSATDPPPVRHRSTTSPFALIVFIRPEVTLCG